MLYKYYKNDPDVCSYIFGTMHLSTKEAYTHVTLAKKYIRSVSLYAAEMDINEAKKAEMITYFMNEEGITFSGYFRPKQYQKYRKTILKSFKTDLYNFERYTPFFVNNLLAELSLSKSEPEYLDHYLWSYAIYEEKEVQGVETFNQQIEVLKKIPLEFQIKSFKTTVKNLSSFRKKINTLNQLYARGDIKTLYKLTKKSMGKIRKLMIYDRNEIMGERAIALHSYKPSFIAIGAAHLGGNKGVLSLLRKAGYKVKEVTC